MSLKIIFPPSDCDDLTAVMHVRVCSFEYNDLPFIKDNYA